MTLLAELQRQGLTRQIASFLATRGPCSSSPRGLLKRSSRALLLGLDLGPNLAVTGSLSAVLWLQVARADGARPSILRYTLLGLVLVPLLLVLTLLTQVRL